MTVSFSILSADADDAASNYSKIYDALSAVLGTFPDYAASSKSDDGLYLSFEITNAEEQQVLAAARRAGVAVSVPAAEAPSKAVEEAAVESVEEEPVATEAAAEAAVESPVAAPTSRRGRRSKQ